MSVLDELIMKTTDEYMREELQTIRLLLPDTNLEFCMRENQYRLTSKTDGLLVAMSYSITPLTDFLRGYRFGYSEGIRQGDITLHLTAGCTVL